MSEQSPDDPAHKADATFEAAVDAIMAAGHRRWPAIGLLRDDFVAHVRAHLDGTAPLDALHGDDLYLACACLHGDAAATAIFDAELLSLVRPPAMRAAASSDLLDEIRQRLRERVLVDGRIRGYSGKGPLAGWLRVAATRLALDLEAHAQRQNRVAAVPDVTAPTPPPERMLMHAQFKEPIEAAFAHAFEGLDDESRRLLRLHYIDGVSMQDLSDELGVDRSTVSRRVAASREQLLASVKQELGDVLQLTPASVETLVNELHSQLHITLRALRQ